MAHRAMLVMIDGARPQAMLRLVVIPELDSAGDAREIVSREMWKTAGGAQKNHGDQP